MIAADKFIEYENVHGDFYGTTKDVIEDFLKEGKPLFLELDVKGALNDFSEIVVLDQSKIHWKGRVSAFRRKPTRLISKLLQSF